jgi:ribonucleotide monophosphatase NagD (HAD superfamily)
MGGESLYFGKPHPNIYDLARARLAALGPVPGPERMLAIGDGIHTDIRGALGEDIDSVFITGGLSATETRTERAPDPEALEAFVTKAQSTPTFAMGFLR